MLSSHVSHLNRPALHGYAKSAEAPVAREADLSARALPDGLAAVSTDVVVVLNDGYYGYLRDGSVAGPFEALDPGGAYAYACEGQGWTADGRYDAFRSEPHARDIVEVWQQTTAG